MTVSLGAENARTGCSSTALEFDEEHVRLRVPNIFAKVLLGWKPAGQPGRQIDVAISLAGMKPSSERTQCVHDTVGVNVRSGLFPWLVCVLENAHSVIFEN